MLMRQGISCLGLVMLLGLAWLLSEHRRRMNWRLILTGLALQLGIAAILLRSRPGQQVFEGMRRLVTSLISSSDEGARFVFSPFFWSREYFAHGPPFVFSVLPAIIFFSSLTAILFHLGILQYLVKLMARAMVWVMDVSGSESLAASANVFVGMTTAPLVVRPYLQTMTRSELMAMMTGGMATVAGSTMPAYAAMGADPGHLMVASLMSAPASLVLAKIMVPETEDSPTKGTVKVEIESRDANVLDAACRGAADGLKLALNIAAMLIAFIALVALVNGMLSVLPTVGGQPFTLQRVLGWCCAPVAWLLGVPWADAPLVGTLLGEKTIFNEFVAYQHLTEPDVVARLSPRSFTLATYALCGFANFGSIAVMIGGVGGLAPKRRGDFARYGLRSMIAGGLAALMTAAIAGLLLPA